MYLTRQDDLFSSRYFKNHEKRFIGANKASGIYMIESTIRINATRMLSFGKQRVVFMILEKKEL